MDNTVKLKMLSVSNNSRVSWTNSTIFACFTSHWCCCIGTDTWHCRQLEITTLYHVSVERLLLFCFTLKLILKSLRWWKGWLIKQYTDLPTPWPDKEEFGYGKIGLLGKKTPGNSATLPEVFWTYIDMRPLQYLLLSPPIYNTITE